MSDVTPNDREAAIRYEPGLYLLDYDGDLLSCYEIITVSSNGNIEISTVERDFVVPDGSKLTRLVLDPDRQRPPVAPVTRELEAAEAELHEWATGKRSWINQMMNLEARVEDRPQTLAWSDARDADNIRMAREKVLALRLLSGVPVTNPNTDKEAEVRRLKRELESMQKHFDAVLNERVILTSAVDRAIGVSIGPDPAVRNKVRMILEAASVEVERLGREYRGEFDDKEAPRA